MRRGCGTLRYSERPQCILQVKGFHHLHTHTLRVKKALWRALSGFSQPDEPLMDSSEAEGNTTQGDPRLDRLNLKRLSEREREAAPDSSGRKDQEHELQLTFL